MPDNFAQGFPAEGGTYVDPVFGETVRRISDVYNTGHRSFQYSGKSQITANNTYCILADGTGSLFLYNMTGGQVRTLTNMAPYIENWQTHPTVDNWAAFMTSRYYRVINVDTNSVVDAETVDFGSTLNNGGESNFLSSDGKNIVGLVGSTLRWYNKDYGGFYSNQPTGISLGSGALYMLPSGDGVVATASTTRYYSVNHATRAWNAGSVVLVNNSSHCSVVTDTAGRNWLVAAGSGVTQIGGTSPNLGDGAGNYPGILFLDVTQPTNWDVSWYLSMGSMGWQDTHYGGNVRANSPNADWVAVSPYGLDNWNSSTPWTPWTYKFQEEIFIVNAKTREVRRLCHHRGRDTSDYYALPFAGLSFDGTLAHFNSNMGRSFSVGGIRYADAYTVTTGLSKSDQNAPSPPKNLSIIQ